MKISLLAIALASAICSASATSSRSWKPPAGAVDVFGAHRSAGKFQSNVPTLKGKSTVVKKADQSHTPTAPKGPSRITKRDDRERVGFGVSQLEIEEQRNKLRKVQTERKQVPESPKSPNSSEPTTPQGSASRFGVTLKPTVRKEATSSDTQAGGDSQSATSPGNRFGVKLRSLRQQA